MTTSATQPRRISWGTVIAGLLALAAAALVVTVQIGGLRIPIRTAGPGAVVVIGLLILAAGLFAVLRANRKPAAPTYGAPPPYGSTPVPPQAAAFVDEPVWADAAPEPVDLVTERDADPRDLRRTVTHPSAAESTVQPEPVDLVTEPHATETIGLSPEATETDPSVVPHATEVLPLTDPTAPTEELPSHTVPAAQGPAADSSGVESNGDAAQSNH